MGTTATSDTSTGGFLAEGNGFVSSLGLKSSADRGQQGKINRGQNGFSLRWLGINIIKKMLGDLGIGVGEI